MVVYEPTEIINEVAKVLHQWLQIPDLYRRRDGAWLEEVNRRGFPLSGGRRVVLETAELYLAYSIAKDLLMESFR